LNDRSAGTNSEHAGETHPVEQPEREDERHAPGTQLRRRDVLDRHVDDRERDERLDDRPREGHDAVDRQRERDRVRDRERGDLQEHRLQSRREKKDSEHEQDVVRPLREDVREPEREVLPDDLCA
jgi:hypothetical protein